jgi:hypothetical protein
MQLSSILLSLAAVSAVVANPIPPYHSGNLQTRDWSPWANPPPPCHSDILQTRNWSPWANPPPPCPSGVLQTRDWNPWSCLTDDQANAIVNTFTKAEQTNGSDTTTFNALMESIANSADQEISDSINFFTGQAPGSITEPNLAAIEAGHAHSGNGVFQITTLNIWHTCNVITWRWRFVLFPGATPVQGINVFVLGIDGKIDQTYIEFNNAVWAKDIGFTVTPPPGFVGRK